MSKQYDIKIAVLVEGDSDQRIVEALLQRVLDVDAKTSVIRFGGQAAVPWLHSTSMQLLREEHCSHVYILVDADTVEPEKIRKRKTTIEAPLRRHNLNDEEVSVHFAIPAIESWLLASYEPKPETVKNPKKRLVEIFREQHKAITPDTLAEETKALDISKARHRAPSLNAFLTAIKSAFP